MTLVVLLLALGLVLARPLLARARRAGAWRREIRRALRERDAVRLARGTPRERRRPCGSGT